MYWRIRLKG